MSIPSSSLNIERDRYIHTHTHKYTHVHTNTHIEREGRGRNFCREWEGYTHTHTHVVSSPSRTACNSSTTNIQIRNKQIRGTLRLPGASQQTKSITFLFHSVLLGLLNTLFRAFLITAWKAGFLPPFKILNKMELVNCVYGNKSPFQHFSWHSNAFLNIIERSFSTWIHLLQATLYFCKSKFQQVWFHSFYSILFALTKLKIPTAISRSPLIAWVGIMFYWLTV